MNTLREDSPYRAVRQYEKQLIDATDKRLYVVFSDLIRSFLRITPKEKTLLEKARKRPYKIGGKLYLNPKTGKPLTKDEWETIKKTLDVAFQFVYDRETEAILARKAVVLGKILTVMHTDIPLDMSALNKKASVDYTYLLNEIEFAEQHAAEMITGLTDRSKKQISAEIINAQRERVSSRELETRLFRTHVNINRDWRRIAETEIANNINTGYIATEIENGTRYLKGISGVNACPWCKANVDNQVVVIGKRANSTGFVQDKTLDREVPYVWPGKSNYGRPRRDWWVASGAQHPHCRCSWQQYVPGFEKYDTQFEDLISQLEMGGVK